MSAILQVLDSDSIFQEVMNHPAWYGSISGLNAEKLLRGQKVPYLYLLRQGEKSVNENEENYYVTFLSSDLSVKHQPLVITNTVEGCFFENGGLLGPYKHVSIHDVLPLIMYCEDGQCVHFNK